MKFNALVPELSVSDFSKSLHFYVEVLGFKIEYQRGENEFAYLSYGEAQLMIDKYKGNWEVAKPDYPFGRGMNLQIETSNIDKIATSLKLHNIKPFKDVFISNYRSDDMIYTQKEILILDPDGYMLRFAQDLQSETHKMKVDEKYYNLLKSGQKTIELRLFDEKRSLINIGDEIEFSNSADLSDKFKAEVINIYKSDNFEMLCNTIKPTQAGFKNKEELVEILEKFYSREKQNLFGVVGIEVKNTKDFE